MPTYKDAGVDIDAGDKLVDWIKDLPKESPQQTNVLGGVGGFAALFDLKQSLEQLNIKNPVLVSATDGVGTKLKWAIELQKYDTVGQDLVAMCVNDLICTGAVPLIFLDYFATGRLNLEQAQPFVAGVQRACNEAQCALVGGETAEMPGMYSGSDFDCAGFSIGVVDRDKILGPHRVKVSQKILAIASDGFHSNGFSLLRKIYDGNAERSKKEQLLRPTRLYVQPVIKLIESIEVSAIAHVTGGGVHNLSRVLPENISVRLHPWDIPDEFLQVEKMGQMQRSELLRTFNCGVCMFALINAEDAEVAIQILQDFDVHSELVGETIAGSREIVWGD